jgi:hypothetical protein
VPATALITCSPHSFTSYFPIALSPRHGNPSHIQKAVFAPVVPGRIPGITKTGKVWKCADWKNGELQAEKTAEAGKKVETGKQKWSDCEDEVVRMML